MADDIKLDLNSINEEVTYKESRLEIVKRFKEIIQFNFDAKQLSDYDGEKLKFNGKLS